MDEILYELREHAAGLNAGRWDYLFSCIKKFRGPATTGPPGAGPADDDRAVHACLHGAARADVPPPRRPRDRRDGGVHPVAPRRRGERHGDGQGPRGQASASRATASTGHGSPIPISSRSRPRSSTASWATAPNQKDRLREEVAVTAEQLVDLRVAGGTVTEAGYRLNVSVAIQYLDCVARRQRRGGDQQPDGGRRDRRDLPLAALAVADDRHDSSTTGAMLGASSIEPSATRSWRASAARRAERVWPRRLALLDRLVLDDEFAEFLDAPGVPALD